MSDLDKDLRQAAELIHSSPTKAVLYVTGGASHASAWLLSVPGASSTILECRVPYDRSSFVDAVGKTVASSLRNFASRDAARALARAAYRRAASMAAPGTRVCGVAAACALVSTISKKGIHRAFVSAHSNDRVIDYELSMHKGHRSRWDEEVLSSRLVLQALVDESGVSSGGDSKTNLVKNQAAFAVSQHSCMSLVRDLMVDGDVLEGPHVQELADPVQCLLDGNIDYAEYSHGSVRRDATGVTLLFPGSFNPVHYGHRGLMKAAQAMYPDAHAAFEISVTNPDKPPLEHNVIRARLAQFKPSDTVVITSAPLFAIKGELFPNCKFVVGVDTALRIVAPKYYGGEAGMISAMVKLYSNGCKFLVAGRLEQRKDVKATDRFLTLSDVPIPIGLEDMFEAIPDSEFRADVSSSPIRKSKGLL